MTDKEKTATMGVKTYTLEKAKADKSQVQSQAIDQEDVWGLLISNNVAINPTYDPSRLLQYVNENNTLLQSVGIMETNIDGSGFHIEVDSPDKTVEDFKNDPDYLKLVGFFDEPWPGVSFLTMRRQIRRDLECTGNGYLEVIRNQLGEIQLIRRIDPASMRLIRLSPVFDRDVTVTRSGEPVVLTMPTRYRGFVQYMGGREYNFFREFGLDKPNIHRKLGHWSEENFGEDSGNEIIHFTVTLDSETPYGLPRWINQMPSVIGSRQAEELNLDYFESGGIPPVLVLLSGGTLADDADRALKNIFGGSPHNQRGAVIQAFSTSGNLDREPNIKMQIERFGSEKLNDSMFEQYDERSSKRVASSFRLPPLFYGKSEDYSFAAAMTSYLVAEAQVFQPERLEFDEIITRTIIAEMVGAGKFYLQSHPITLPDTERQFLGLEMIRDKISGSELVSVVNEITGLDAKYDEEKDVDPLMQAEQMLDQTQPDDLIVEDVEKSDVGSFEVYSLAREWARTMSKSSSHPNRQVLKMTIDMLNVHERQLFDELLAREFFEDAHELDIAGTANLASAMYSMSA